MPLDHADRGDMAVTTLIEHLREARWLTRQRVVLGGYVLLLAQGTILIMLALWQHGVITAEVSKTSSDFVSFFAAGKLTLAGTPALAYDHTAHFLAERQFTVTGAPYQFFFYPPVFLLLCAPLALLPYFVAFYVFEAVTLGAFMLTMRGLLSRFGWSWVAPVLGFPAIFWTLGLGQNAFLTAALFGAFTLMIERRPAVAGLLLGLLCYKPHFGLLAPVALACGGRWRAFFVAAATVGALVGLSVALFGTGTWHAYLTAFGGSDAVYGSGRIDYAGMVTPFGGARLLGFGRVTASAVQVVMSVAMAALVGLVWRRTPNENLRAAILPPATLLAVPMALLYDHLLLLVAVGWLLRDARESGWLPWEKTWLVAIYAASLVAYVGASAWHIPLGPLVSLGVLLMIPRRLGWCPTLRVARLSRRPAAALSR
jgi:Glycosyltransferase family 87